MRSTEILLVDLDDFVGLDIYLVGKDSAGTSDSAHFLGIVEALQYSGASGMTCRVFAARLTWKVCSIGAGQPLDTIFIKYCDPTRVALQGAVPSAFLWILRIDHFPIMRKPAFARQVQFSP